MNALKHRFSSQEIVLEGEDAGQFDALRAQLKQNLIPAPLYNESSLIALQHYCGD